MIKTLEETSKALLCITLLLSMILGLMGAAIINDNASYSSHPDFLALVGGKLPYLSGLLLGTVLTSFKIILIDKSCKKVINMDPSAGKLYATGQYFTRFILTAGALVSAMLVPQFGFLGCVLGILTLQIAGYLTPIWEKRKKVDI